MPIKKYELRPIAMGEINAELTVAERRLVTGFLQRRQELLPKAREELAQRLASPLHEKYGGEHLRRRNVPRAPGEGTAS